MRRITALSILAMPLLAGGQNLVLNGDFEPSDCPASGPISQVIPPWNDPWTSVDHYGPCTNSGSATTTNNMTPQSGMGNIGLYAYGEFPNSGRWNREYITGQLAAPLEAGKEYRLRYWVYPVLVGQFYINAGISGPGALFTEAPPNLDLNVGLIEDSRALYPGESITNRTSWNLVCITFTARGGETFITMGSFDIDSELNPVPLDPNVPSTLGYYLIDNIWLEEMSDPVLPAAVSICQNEPYTLRVPEGLIGMWDDGSTNAQRTIYHPGTYSFIYQDGPCLREDIVEVSATYCEECHAYIPNSFTPDGDGENDEWKPVIGCDPEAYRLEVYNRWGELLFRTSDPQESWAPDPSFPVGMYHAKLTLTYLFRGDVRPLEHFVCIHLIR